MGVTDAMLGSLDVQVTTRPKSMTLPLASLRTALNERFSFLAMAGGFDGEMVTDATATLAPGAGRTLMVPSPDFPATFAEMRVVPGPTPVTTPSSEMTAMLGSSVD